MRLEGSWKAISALLMVGHFAIPFFFFMGRTTKRRDWPLIAGSLWVLAMHFVDMYWVVIPSIEGLGARPGIVDAASLLAVGGAFLAAFGWLLVGSPLVPAGDPRLSESLAFENV